MTQLIANKANLRKLMKDVLKNISADEKQRQTSIVTDYLLNHDEKFKNAKHIAVYLAMKSEEVDTIPLIETLLTQHTNKSIYVPHVEMDKKNLENTRPEMVFFRLENIEQYNNEMNDNNKFKLRQFNNPSRMVKADESLFDLIIVPGLAFDVFKHDSLSEGHKDKFISRLGRGKGYYDVFLSKIPSCYTIGVGFNEQFIPLNEKFLNENLRVPIDINRDVLLNEFICENVINQKEKQSIINSNI